MHQPVYPPARPSRRLTTHPSVDHSIIETGGIDFLLDQGRVRPLRPDAVPSGQAGTEEEDSRSLVSGVGRCGSRGCFVLGLLAAEKCYCEDGEEQMSEYHSRMPDAMLHCQSLSRTYRSGGQDLTVLKDITFRLEPGDFLAILGPSGSGKTTLLGLLAGLDQPTAGTVYLDGQELGSMSEDERAKLRAEKIGFVFQSFQLMPTLTAQENVQVPLELRGEPGAMSRARALLARVGLHGREHHYPVQLSGGEQQRVALARGFSSRPKVLFADEPTGNLDASTGATIIELMSNLNQDSGTTLVLVTHDLELAARAGRIIRLADGKVVSDSAA